MLKGLFQSQPVGSSPTSGDPITPTQAAVQKRWLDYRRIFPGLRQPQSVELTSLRYPTGGRGRVSLSDRISER